MLNWIGVLKLNQKISWVIHNTIF